MTSAVVLDIAKPPPAATCGVSPKHSHMSAMVLCGFPFDTFMMYSIENLQIHAPPS